MSVLRRKDTVLVITGKAKGSQGKILKVIKEKNTVLVEGINKAKKHEKPNPKNEKGGIVEKEMPIHISNVMLINTKSGKPAKVVWRKNEDGKKIRVEKKTGTPIE